MSKKLTDKEIEALKKDISEVKDVFKDSHLGEKKPSYDDIKKLEEMVRRDILSFWLPNPVISHHHTTTGESVVRTEGSFGGYVNRDDATILFRVNTATYHNEDRGFGSGISVERTIESEISDLQGEVMRDELYNFYFDGGGRIYSGRVQITEIDNTGSKLIARMRVVGALNIT